MFYSDLNDSLVDFIKNLLSKVKPFQKYKVIEVLEIIKTNRNEKISSCLDRVNDI